MLYHFVLPNNILVTTTGNPNPNAYYICMQKPHPQNRGNNQSPNGNDCMDC